MCGGGDGMSCSAGGCGAGGCFGVHGLTTGCQGIGCAMFWAPFFCSVPGCVAGVGYGVSLCVVGDRDGYALTRNLQVNIEKSKCRSYNNK